MKIINPFKKIGRVKRKYLMSVFMDNDYFLIESYTENKVYMSESIYVTSISHENGETEYLQCIKGKEEEITENQYDSILKSTNRKPLSLEHRVYVLDGINTMDVSLVDDTWYQGDVVFENKTYFKQWEKKLRATKYILDDITDKAELQEYTYWFGTRVHKVVKEK